MTKIYPMTETVRTSWQTHQHRAVAVFAGQCQVWRVVHISQQAENQESALHNSELLNLQTCTAKITGDSSA